MGYCCCETIEKLCLCLFGILTGSKESKATKALGDTEGTESTESFEKDESDEKIQKNKSDESIENIERYEQSKKVSGTANVHGESFSILCERKTADSYKRLVKSIVVTIYNRKTVRCLIANASLVFVPRRVWPAYVLTYIRGYLCVQPENSVACLIGASPVTYLSKYITKGTVPLLENNILADTSTKGFEEYSYGKTEG